MTIRTAQGFTLPEMMMVIGIISIISVMVILRWPVNIINVDAATKQLASDIRYTQSLAMTKGSRYYLIKQSANSYRILSAAGTPMMFPMGGTTMTLGSGITFSSLSNLPNNLIAFDGRGTPYTDSTLPGTALAATATMTLTVGGSSESVAITPVTGEVVVQ